MVWKKIISKIKDILRYSRVSLIEQEKTKLLLGRLMSNQVKLMGDVKSLSEVEFSIFSQWGDDGIIQWLIHKLDISEKTFIEFGIEDYTESNTRFLLMNNNWSGFVMDADIENIKKLRNSYYYWKYDLQCKAAFVNRNNINDLLAESGFVGECGLLHIDLDGNDYYIWDAITVVSPVIVIIEYNSLFGIERPIAIIYDDNFNRTKAHYSNLYWGTSLKSLYLLAQRKGYSFIGCNSAGNNAYFVRNDKLNETVKPISLENGFVESKFRESRDKRRRLNYLSKSEGKKLLSGMPVFNTETNTIEYL